MNYNFDARGNRTQLNGNIPDCILNPVRDINRNFNWNSLNQMSGFKSGNETTVTTNATYNYNQDGLRYQKTVATTIGAATTTLTTKYFYDDGGRTIAETNSANAVQAQVVWGHKPLMRIVGGNYYYYHYNGHGDVVSITDSTGKSVNTYTYDTWGNLTSKVETIDNPILYSGEYYDKESGLYYLRARMYDPVDGRFISRDSYEGKLTNPMSQNRYSYCVNNPLIYVDPTGHETGAVTYNSASMLESSVDPRGCKSIYDFMIGDSIKTAADEDASGLSRTIAGGDIALTLVAFGASNSKKVVIKGSEKIYEKFAAWAAKGDANAIVYFAYREGKAVYVGITRQDILKRFAQHNSGIFNRKFTDIANVLPEGMKVTWNQARSLEQYIIKEYRSFDNILNSVSPKRDIYPEVLKWAEEFIKKNEIKLP